MIPRRPTSQKPTTTILATCHGCGPVELKPLQIQLVICSRSEWSYYAFTCPICHERSKHEADPTIAAMLTSGGVRPERWHIPAEALEQHDGPAISHDDVLDFSLGLDRVAAEAAALR